MAEYAYVASESQALLTWKGLRAATASKDKGQKQILSNVSGYVKPKEMMAIMGPSGCGKTTLLDTLAGRTQTNLQVTGDILVNGHPTKMSYGTVAYVPQEDLLTGTLTVRETLQYTARLRLAIPARARDALVDRILLDLGLAPAADTPIGTILIKGVSGGQKRRVSIACEVLVEPALLFLDEPTSGLDAASAFFCASALRKLTDEGRTVIMSIHQPSMEVFELFDTLMLLSRGEMVYFGAGKRAAEFYGGAGLPCPVNRSPPDHFIHCMNTDFKRQAEDFDEPVEALSPESTAKEEGHGNEGIRVSSVKERASFRSLAVPLVDAEKGIQALRSEFEASLRKPLEDSLSNLTASKGAQHRGIMNSVSALSQTMTLTQRSLLNAYRDIGVFWIRVAMYIGLSLCLGTVYFGLDQSWRDTTSRGGLLMFSMSFLTFMSISAFPSFVEEMRVVLRERLNGYYGIGAYTLGNMLATLPFLAIIAFACSILIVFLAGLGDTADQVFYFIISLFSALFTVESLMVAIAAVVPHYLIGLAAGAGLLGVFMPTCGYIIPISELPDPVWRYPFHYIGFHTYALHGLVHNEFKGTSGWGCPCEVDPDGCPDPDCMLTGDQALRALDFAQDRSKWLDILILLVMALFLRFAFFALLKLREATSK